MRVYLFDDGIARFATNPYQSPKDGDIKDLFQHLTNYSINKQSNKYVQNENQDGGSGSSSGQTGTRPVHKRSLKQIYKYLESAGRSVDKLKEDIKDLIVKTVITGQNSLHHIYRTCQPDDLENQLCFQILGFDVIFDQSLKPWLIEINQSPSFATDSAFDYALKKKLMEDTFKLLNLTPERRQMYAEQREKQYLERLTTAGKGQKLTFEQKEFKRFEIDKLRDELEIPLLQDGGYELIFPVKDDEEKMREYNSYLKLAKDLQDQFTHGRKAGMKDENVYDIILKAQTRTGITSQVQRPKTAQIQRHTFASSQKNEKRAPPNQAKQSHTKYIEQFENNIKSNMLDNIRNQKEEHRLKQRIQRAQIIQNIKKQVLESDKQLSVKKKVEEMTRALIDKPTPEKEQKEHRWDYKSKNQDIDRRDKTPILEPVLHNKLRSSESQSKGFFESNSKLNGDMRNPYTKLFRAEAAALQSSSISQTSLTPLSNSTLHEIRRSIPVPSHQPVKPYDNLPSQELTRPEKKKPQLTPFSELRKGKDLPNRFEAEKQDKFVPVLESKKCPGIRNNGIQEDSNRQVIVSPTSSSRLDDSAIKQIFENRNQTTQNIQKRTFPNNQSGLTSDNDKSSTLNQNARTRHVSAFPGVMGREQSQSRASVDKQKYVPFYKRARGSSIVQRSRAQVASSQQSKSANQSPRLKQQEEKGKELPRQKFPLRNEISSKTAPEDKQISSSHIIPIKEDPTEKLKDQMNEKYQKHRKELREREQNTESINSKRNDKDEEDPLKNLLPENKDMSIYSKLVEFNDEAKQIDYEPEVQEPQYNFKSELQEPEHNFKPDAQEPKHNFYPESKVEPNIFKNEKIDETYGFETTERKKRLGQESKIKSESDDEVLFGVEPILQESELLTEESRIEGKIPKKKEHKPLNQSFNSFEHGWKNELKQFHKKRELSPARPKAVNIMNMQKQKSPEVMSPYKQNFPSDASDPKQKESNANSTNKQKITELANPSRAKVSEIINQSKAKPQHREIGPLLMLENIIQSKHTKIAQQPPSKPKQETKKDINSPIKPKVTEHSNLSKSKASDISSPTKAPSALRPFSAAQKSESQSHSKSKSDIPSNQKVKLSENSTPQREKQNRTELKSPLLNIVSTTNETSPAKPKLMEVKRATSPLRLQGFQTSSTPQPFVPQVIDARLTKDYPIEPIKLYEDETYQQYGSYLLSPKQHQPKLQSKVEVKKAKKKPKKKQGFKNLAQESMIVSLEIVQQNDVRSQQTAHFEVLSLSDGTYKQEYEIADSIDGVECIQYQDSLEGSPKKEAKKQKTAKKKKKVLSPKASKTKKKGQEGTSTDMRNSMHFHSQSNMLVPVKLPNKALEQSQPSILFPQKNQDYVASEAKISLLEKRDAVVASYRKSSQGEDPERRIQASASVQDAAGSTGNNKDKRKPSGIITLWKNKGTKDAKKPSLAQNQTAGVLPREELTAIDYANLNKFQEHLQEDSPVFSPSPAEPNPYISPKKQPKNKNKSEKPEKVGQKQKNTTAKELNQDLMYYEAIKPVLPSQMTYENTDQFRNENAVASPNAGGIENEFYFGERKSVNSDLLDIFKNKNDAFDPASPKASGGPNPKEKQKSKSPVKQEKKKKNPILQQKQAKSQFLKLINELKEQGKDPVFNLTTDFTTNWNIGNGFLSVIKQCTHNRTGYHIALKTYEKKLLTRKSQLMAIHREIYILAGLDHPNIMRLFEVIDTKTHVNLVAELCNGCSLIDYIRAYGQKGKFGLNGKTTWYLSEHQAKGIFKQLLNALTYIHSLGLVHRGLKIQDIIINDQNQEIKLIDFGQATSFQQNDQLAQLGGAPQYKKAETINQKNQMGQIEDTEALGIILFILLTGGTPSWSKYKSDIFPKIQAEQYRLPISEHQTTGQMYEMFSANVQDIMQKIFDPYHQPRHTVKDFLAHPWHQSFYFANQSPTKSKKNYKQQLLGE